jgi:hypothetical protein
MSSLKKKDKKKIEKITADYYDDKDDDEDEEDRIAAVTEAAVHYGAGGGEVHRLFGTKRRTSRRSRSRKSRKSRRRTSRKRNFGTSENPYLKRFLIIALFMIIRSIAKGKPYTTTVHNDLNMLTVNAINALTITSILELITKLVGPENRDKILLAYTLFAIGNDVGLI